MSSLVVIRSLEIDTKISLNEFNKTVCEKILSAADKAIPKYSVFTNKHPLPKFIIDKLKNVGFIIENT